MLTTPHKKLNPSPSSLFFISQMGCCLSKNEDFNTTPSPPFPPKPHLYHEPVKAPLSPVFEEESVKEVLSETPKPKPPIPNPEPEPKASNVLKIQEENKKEEENKIPIVPIEKEKKEKVNNNVVVSEEISEVSEICSLSETISTTTITSRKEDEEGEVQQRVHHRSPAKILRKRSIPGEFVGKHERGSKSPSRRLNPSPGRRNEEVGPAAGRRIADNNRVRRDLGERSGRRSRSPAARANLGTSRANVGRSPSRKAPRSPSRAPHPPTALEKSDRKIEETKGGGETNESMENPLVSLECFIFL